MPRILVADDHAVVRRGVIEILRDSVPGATFGEAETGGRALELARAEKWDLAILDVSLPDQSGLEVLKQIRGFAPRLPVLVLSMHPEEQFALRTLRAGASGYVTKRTAPQEIGEAVRRVLAGGRYITPSLAERMALEMAERIEKAPHERLSDREYQVFRRLALGKTVKEIASELSVSVQTVSTYRARILTKMGFRTNADLTEYAIRDHLLE
ncbi:MAG TPA: response regulator transcription factor [Thermoanaerobaculia bacterium]|jgi:DNA-binding NarL/FixJ family response regulator|nr:response regulator transcription factor [Thermoanaerobaculia bacterium]